MDKRIWAVGGGKGGTGKINAGNFSKLQLAWRFKTDMFGPRAEFNYQATPLMANGRLYTVAGTRRAAVVLDAVTGELLWMHSLDEGKRGAAAPRLLSGRGLSYWTDGKDERVIYVTPGYQMVALDAKTGARVRNFGTDGVVDSSRTTTRRGSTSRRRRWGCTRRPSSSRRT